MRDSHVDIYSSLVFYITFFYYLMDGVGRDDSSISYTEQKADEKAAQLDPHFRFGTKIFHRYTTQENI